MATELIREDSVKILSKDNVLWRNKFPSALLFSPRYHIWNVMYQPIPSVIIPPGNPGAFDQNFCLTRAGHLS